MNTNAVGCVLVLLTLAVASVLASEPKFFRSPFEPTETDPFAQAKEKPKEPETEKPKPEPDKKLTQPPKTDLFALDSPDSQFTPGFNPQMMGDFGILFARRTITINGTQTITTTTRFSSNEGMEDITTTTTIPVTQRRTILVPFASSAAAFKVAENESPRPIDRVFGLYNYFGGIRGGNSPSSSTFVAGLPDTSNPDVITTTDVSTVFPATRVQGDLHREVIGFEKTFLDGYASVEVRLPFLQANSNLQGFGGQNVGDLTIVTKYAFLLDNTIGDVFSAGLAITAPTGPSVDTIAGPLHSTLIQPWTGYIWNFDSFFIQGIHSIVVPTDPRDVTLLFNDVAVNYWLYRGLPEQFLNYIVPLVEVHVTTPLNHRNQDNLIFVPDQVVLTGGVHFGLLTNTRLSLGAATPLTGPQPFNVEAFVQLNRFF